MSPQMEIIGQAVRLPINNRYIQRRINLCLSLAILR